MLKNLGFTLIEMMIVVAIIGVIAAFALPNYQAHVRKTKRVEMMTEMQNVGNKIEARKMVEGNYNFINTASTNYQNINYPLNKPNYTYSVAPANSNWVITATPVSTGDMKTDGTLTLNWQGQKCHNADCNGDDWKK